jgi:hypothetical protein
VLLLKDGRQVRIDSVLAFEERQATYNFAVDDLHCYAVSDLAVLVHNGCGEGKYRGGKHGDIKGPRGDGLDSHHVPADSISPLSRDSGPAFQMDPADHRLMSSTGNSAAAQTWRNTQAALIAQGRFRDAMQMDIDEAKLLFGNKYDQAIQETLDYATTLGL